jgi:hypothetical protein
MGLTHQQETKFWEFFAKRNIPVKCPFCGTTGKTNFQTGEFIEFVPVPTDVNQHKETMLQLHCSTCAFISLFNFSPDDLRHCQEIT